MITNIIIDFVNTDEEKEVKNEITTKAIEDKFAVCINEFGIQNEWITSKIIDNKSLDSLDKVFFVKIPTDLSIPSFLKEVESKFLFQPVEIISEERKDNGNSTLKIYSNNNLKLQVYLNYDKDISREKFRFAFLVNDFNELSSEESKKILESQFKLAVGIIPSENSFLKLDDIKSLKKENYLIINDDVSDSKYELDPSLSKVRLKSSIISIVEDFGSSIFYMIDKSSELYTSTAYNFIRDELLKRKIRLHSYDNFIDLRGKEKNDLISLFKFYCEDNTHNKKVFIIDFNGLDILTNSIKAFLKKGDKLVNPSELIFAD